MASLSDAELKSMSQDERAKALGMTTEQLTGRSLFIEFSQDDGYHAFVGAYGPIPEYKWARRKNVLDAANTQYSNLKAFRKFCVDVHDFLPSLR